METNFVRTEFDSAGKKNKIGKASCHHEKLKMSGSAKKKWKGAFLL